MNNQWEEDIRRKLEGLEEPSPQLSWNEIDKALTARRQHQRARVVALRQYRRMAAAAVVAVVVAGTTVLFVKNNRNDGTQTAVETASVIDNGRQKTASGEKEIKDNNDTPVSVANSGGRMLCLMTTAKPGLTHGMCSAAAEVEQTVGGVDGRPVDSITVAESTTTVAEPQSSNAGKNVAQSQQGQRHQGTTAHEPRKYRYNSLFAEADVSAKRTGGRSQIDVKAYVTNAALGSNVSSVQPLMLASASPYGDYEEEMNGNGVSTVAPTVAEEQCNVSHSQPVRLGVEVGFRLSDRITLTTGLSYTTLRSDIDRTIGTERSTTVQRLHYIGIPVGLNYSLWRNRSFNVYLGGGGMVERMVSGKAVTETVGQGQQEASVSERISSGRLQFSVHASVGAEYFFLPTAGLFVEPGASYHFNNGSGLSTIYSDKPLNLNLSLGVRFNF